MSLKRLGMAKMMFRNGVTKGSRGDTTGGVKAILRAIIPFLELKIES